jgi:hypothetical protein
MTTLRGAVKVAVMSKNLVFPMAFYAFYMFALAVYMFRSRVRALKSGEVSFKYFRTYSSESPTDRLLVIGRHYDNQFQVPILFFITCLAHFCVNQTNILTVILAWFFVGSRLIHSYIHLGENRIQKRAAAFCLGWLVLMAMWAQLLIFAL